MTPEFEAIENASKINKRSVASAQEEAWSDLKLTTKPASKATRESDQTIDFTYGHQLDDIIQYHTQTSAEHGTRAHDPIDMQLNSRHSILPEESHFANPSLQQNWAPREEELSVIPQNDAQPRRESHHARLTPPAIGSPIEMLGPQDYTANGLSNSSLRIPEQPRERPIPAPDIVIDHDRMVERARQAARRSGRHGF